MNDPRTAPLRALQFLLTHAAIQYPECAAEARGLQADLLIVAQPAPVVHAVPVQAATQQTAQHPAQQTAPVIHAVPQQHPAPEPPAAPAPKE